METIRVGLIGSQFISSIHCEALRSVPFTEIVAVASATEAHASAFAERHGIPHWFTDFRKMGCPTIYIARRLSWPQRRESMSSVRSPCA